MVRFKHVTRCLENDVISDPAPFTPKIHYIDHAMSVAQMCAFFPGLKREDLPKSSASGTPDAEQPLATATKTNTAVRIRSAR